MAPLRRAEQLSARAARTAAGAAAALVVACGASSSSSGTTPGSACVQGLTPSCQALYSPPVFDTLYAKIFVPTCATGSGTCHTGDAAKGGLIFGTADDAYERLVGGHRVTPNDPGCSELMKRLTSTDPTYHMPPGTASLSGPEECAIVQWIAGGAKR